MYVTVSRTKKTHKFITISVLSFRNRVRSRQIGSLGDANSYTSLPPMASSEFSRIHIYLVYVLLLYICTYATCILSDYTG